MGLADPGRAADEQRVVGLGGHLGDGQRGGVGEAVAVADDELLEGELGVAERPRRASAAPAAVPGEGCACLAPVRAHEAAAGRTRRVERAATTTSGPRTASTLACSTRPKRSPIQRQACGGASSEQALVGELDAPAAARARCGRWARRRRGRAATCTRDQMCSSSGLTAASIRSSPRESDGNYSKEDPRARLGDYTQRLSGARRGCSQLAGKIGGCPRSILGPLAIGVMTSPRGRGDGAT